MTSALVVAADRGDDGVAGAEHLGAELGAALQDQLGPAVVVCTHPIRSGRPHYAVSVAFEASVAVPHLFGLGARMSLAASTPWTAGNSRWASGAAQALAAHESWTGGRAVRFPGQERLTGTVAIGDVLAGTAIEEVRTLGGPDPTLAWLATREHVRPTYLDGRLVLLVRPAGAGTVIPFEIADPHPCCGGH